MNNVFFTNGEGLTSTSANFYANMAQELIQADMEKLNRVKFFETRISSIGSQVEQLMSCGQNSLEFIDEALIRVASMNAFCAWVREAIKEKEAQASRIVTISLEDWAEEQGISIPMSIRYPEAPKQAYEADILATWDAAKRNKYLTLEAYASTYGKYIHPKGAFSNARKGLNEASNTPITKEGSGRDLILYIHEPTITLEDVDAKFMSLQNQYRSYEKELNSMKAELKETVNAGTIENSNAYKIALEDYRLACEARNQKVSSIVTKYNEWKTMENERVAKLKILIPKNLMETFELIKSHEKE